MIFLCEIIKKEKQQTNLNKSTFCNLLKKNYNTRTSSDFKSFIYTNREKLLQRLRLSYLVSSYVN